MTSNHPLDEDATIARMRDVLKRQQVAFMTEGPPSTALRIDRIDRVIQLLLVNQQRLCRALASDFSWRSHDQSLMSDVLLSVAGFKYVRKHLRNWMKPQRRSPEMGAGRLGAKAEIYFQPLGSIGIMAPWNFPVAIALGPLAEALAAGNRAMIMLSEFTPATAALLIELLAGVFDETEVAAFVGGAKVGAAFSGLPLDHIVFTGSPRVGKLVMAAAAENLTPLTLELGGKSPTIIGRGADLDSAARRIWGGKAVNSGQACIAPDYVLVHEDDREHLLTRMQTELQHIFQSDLRFGGCGNSGFGHYRGGEGFKAFSLQRLVFKPAWFDVMGLLRPPYGSLLRRVMGALLKAPAEKQQRSRA
ncbi:UNVERIFIED_ORG: acyl-CoA reductase-like NAD-dependent aldehyde dehydrogenase [Pseudomonas reinekei]|nr:acyl-CoA reductase-like NAD-dependent aldehyde dehydrogenase [Pseudomonas reinekei]